MLTVDEAREKILSAARVSLVHVDVLLADAVGRVLAADIHATCQVPPCDNSAMDGYALCVEHSGDGKKIPVAGVIYAGDAPGVLPSGCALRIFTGAPVPQGADAVVMQEDVMQEDVLLNGDVITLKSDAVLRAGENIRRAGEDIQLGEKLFAAGHCLRARDIGLLASVGIHSVKVFETLRVGLLCTGDELLEPGDQPASGKIYNSNRYLLAAILREMGCQVIDAGKVKDDLAATQHALQDLAAQVDVVISTGGVSVGDADYVKQAVTALGQLDVWKIAVKPGKPLAFGVVSGRPFFGLPGNPVSAFVTFLLFVRPFLQLARGGVVQPLRSLPVQAGFSHLVKGKREEYLRVQLQQNSDGNLCAVAYPNQGSGVLSSVCWADALMRVPVGKVFSAGECVECFLLP
jgi:molybdopterin molybdotransferase